MGRGQQGELARGWARERDKGDTARGRELGRGDLTNGAHAVGEPLVIFFLHSNGAPGRGASLLIFFLLFDIMNIFKFHGHFLNS